MDVAVGSTNPVKVAAAEAVLRRIYGPEVRVEAVAVESGVSPQPWGDEEDAPWRAHAGGSCAAVQWGHVGRRLRGRAAGGRRRGVHFRLVRRRAHRGHPCHAEFPHHQRGWGGRGG